MGIELEQQSGQHNKEHSRPNVRINLEITEGEPQRKDVATANCSGIAEHDKENRGCTSGSTDKVLPSDGVVVNFNKKIEPHDGMEFESKDDAFLFYKEYAKTVGFSTITKASRRSRMSGKFIDAKFVCTRYGSKRESSTSATQEPIPNLDSTMIDPIKKKRGRINQSWSKTDCKACMHVKRRHDGRWIIRDFIKEHNHEIFPDQAHYFRCHRNIDLDNRNIDTLQAIRARTKKMYLTMSRQSCGIKKVENQKSGNSHGGGQHLVLEEGDAQIMLEHFMCMQDENPNFFYALDLNEEQRLRSVLWVDAKGRFDFGYFGDVVFFDTSYIKNEYKLSFAPFIGVNHHFQFLVLGYALIADGTKSTYAWVMRAWRRAMGGQTPKVILTDQDKALKEAITEVFPGSRHCFCLWHILSKIPEKLSYLTRQDDTFMSKFNKCIFKSWTNEKFEKRWWKMIGEFNLRNEAWLQSLYEDRERWCPTYMRNIFLAGMCTPQRSESLHYLFDKFMQRKTTLKEFLDHYKSFLREKYEEEARADFETWHKQPGLKSPSPFGKQMATIYTHALFKKFQVEVLGVVACHPKKENEDGTTVTFKVQDFEENQDFIVVWNELAYDVSCTCRMFEYNGFLCRHVLIVLQISGVHSIPCQYILKRWSKDAKSGQTMRLGLDMVESRAQRYNNICQRAFRLGDEGSLSQESYNIAFKALEKALQMCESVNSLNQGVLEPCSPSTHDSLHEFEEVTHLNRISKTNKKMSFMKKGKVQSEPELLTIGMHDSWQQMEQLNSRVPTLDGYFGSQQIVQVMGQYTTIAPGHDDFYSNQQNMQGLGQLNSIAPIHDSRYLTEQRVHGLGQLQFRSQGIQSFDIQDSLQDMGHSNVVGPMQLHGMTSKHMLPKHLSQ